MEFTDFKAFGLDASIMEGIESMGYENPTPVQAQVIPAIMQGRDIIAAAQTGTGKTAAFLLPILHSLLTRGHETNSVNALIIVPTRELAMQIEQNIEAMAYFTSVSCVSVYGGGVGELFAAEKKALSHGADIVVCTPGRMISHLNMGYVKLQGLKYLVLDEADRMLDMGFHGDIMRILSFLPKERQNLMFSATMPPKIRELTNKILVDPAQINIAISRPAENINQQAVMVFDAQKVPVVRHILKTRPHRLAIVFCSSKESVKKLAFDLKRARLPVEDIHSDLEQAQREAVLLNFRNGKTSILVATDIMSRGIDIDSIDIVINYDVPHDGEDYVHRIGRTARAEATGEAYTLITPATMRKFAGIERLIGREITRMPVPEELGPVPEYDPNKRPERGGGRGQGRGSGQGNRGRDNAGRPAHGRKEGGGRGKTDQRKTGKPSFRNRNPNRGSEGRPPATGNTPG